MASRGDRCGRNPERARLPALEGRKVEDCNLVDAVGQQKLRVKLS